MQYPGRIIKVGETDAAVVKTLKLQLNKLLAADAVPEFRLDPDDPNFGPRMRQTIKLFQARNVDSGGRPLKQDGEVASITWEALFGAEAVASAGQAGNALLAKVLEVAAAEVAKEVREVPRNSNRGPQVDEYLKRVGVPAGLAWCCAFTYWCFDEAARQMGGANPMVRTAGCMDHWNRSPGKRAQRILAASAVMNPEQIKPGMIFIMDHGGGLGHTGFVEKVDGGLITTIEGNTDASKTREGGGVYRLNRKVAEINKGFIDYGSA